MINYKANEKNICSNGTSLKGYIVTTYDKLVKFFGQPKDGSADGKTTCEWVIEFEDGTVATVHDWKLKSTPKEVYKWSVGGHSHRVIELLNKATNDEMHCIKL